jgi:hypothetical protein
MQLATRIPYLFAAARMTGKARTAALEFGAIALLFLVVSALSAFYQRVTLLRYWDADEYYWMAVLMQKDAPVIGSAPWVYRIGTPWLASFAPKPRIANAVPFFVINIASAIASALLLAIWLRRFVRSSFVRVLLVVLFIAAWHAPTRFVYYYPMYVDPLFIAFMMLGVLLVDATRHGAPERAAPVLTLVSFLGTLCRESMLLVPLAFLCVHNPLSAGKGRWRPVRDTVAALAPLAASVLALAYVRAVAFPTEPYSASAEALAMVRKKPVFTWILAWFITFGPGVLAVICFDGRRARRFLQERPHLAFHLAACGLLGFFGGTDTERILIWSMPVIYALAGQALERHAAILKNAPLVIVLVIAQAVSARIFWPIPSPKYDPQPFAELPSLPAKVYDALNRLIVMDTYNLNMWSYFGSRPWHAVLLAYDVLFVVAIVAWLRMRARHVPMPALAG